MILISSLILITDTENKITRKDREICYRKYSVHRSNGNIVITTCTTARVTTHLHDFSQAV